MKRLTILAAIALSTAALTSCSFGGNGAGNILAGALGQQGSNTASTLAKGVAQTIVSQGTLSNLLSTFLGGVAINEQTLYGTWTYKGVDVAFESENLLAKAGGAVAAGSIEEKIDAQLTKYGIKPGAVKFTFNADHTFTANLGGRNINGTYTYDAQTRKLNLVAALGLFNQSCTVGSNGQGISLLFPADKILTLASTVGSIAGGNNSTIASLSSLLGNYKGMQIGLQMTK